MPGIEVDHSVWTSSNDGQFNHTMVSNNNGEATSPPTWLDNGAMSWLGASATDEVSAGSPERRAGYPSEKSRNPHEQYSSNQYVSSHSDPKVNGELHLGLASSTPGQLVFKPHKPLPRRRHFSDNSVNLRSQFNTAGTEPSVHSNGDITQSATPSTPVNVSSSQSLLPTPPGLQHELSEYDFENSSNAETTILRSRIVTPAPQHSPPTPDNTPPRLDPPLKGRHFLGTQPSLASTRAESFQTAREEMSSEDEADVYPTPKMASVPQWLRTVSSTNKVPFQIRPSPLAQDDEDLQSFGAARDVLKSEAVHSVRNKDPNKPWEDQTSSNRSNSKLYCSQDTSPASPGIESLPPLMSSNVSEEQVDDLVKPISSGQQGQPSLVSPHPLSQDPLAKATSNTSVGGVEMLSEDRTQPSSDHTPADTPAEIDFPRRGHSLRDRVEQSQRIEASHSTEQFGKEIGWSQSARSPDLNTRVNSWRFSSTSATSTVEAIVVDTEPKRQQTLRHRGRNASLRSASSPIPGSYRNSLLSISDSPRRLQHKKARLSNQTRWSFGSELSRSLSVSSAIPPQPKPEVIHVAVIPERASSLRSSANSSNRHSESLSAASGGRRSMNTDVRGEGFDHFRHSRALSEPFSTTMNSVNRGRDKRFPPPVPARSSSLSTPTSQSNSRANSIANSITSEHLRLRRVAAEEDVRQTLARMESERATPARHARISQSDTLETTLPELDAEHWAVPRPPSAQRTPFSQQSLHSASPGVFEMGEARAVNFFPHNNHSLQLIENNHIPESRAVQGLHTSGRNLQLVMDEPITPVIPSLPTLSVESPLRNPRDPPKPPEFKVIPPTPAALTPTGNFDRRLNTKDTSKESHSRSRRFGSLKRPSIANQERSESFVKSLGRTFSLNAKNKKAGQDLDGTLHPFWRPRGFWDEFSESDDDEVDQYENRERGVVSNSLGMPRKRVIIDGPISLVRKISDGSSRRRQKRRVSKRDSYGSLSRLRMGRKIHKVPGLGLRFQVVGLRDLQQRMVSAKNRKEDERRDKRREELRRSIGPNVISQGDSRYISAGITPPNASLTSEMD